MKRILFAVTILLSMGLMSPAFAADAGPDASVEVADEVPSEAPVDTADTAPAVPNPVSVIGKVIQFAKTGEGVGAIGGILLLLVWIARNLVLKRVDWANTRFGGYAISFGLAVVPLMALSMYETGRFDAALLLSTALGALASGKVHSMATKEPASG